MSTPLTIAVIGATGRTGLWIVKEALAGGHRVRAIVRNPAGWSLRHENLTVVEGSPNDEQVLRNAFIGCEAVLSALNISRTSEFPWSPLRSPSDLLSSTMKKVVALCEELQIRRLLVITAWGVHETKKDLPGWFRFFIDNSKLKIAYKDHERQEEVIDKSGLDWTIIRPVGLSNSEKDQEVKVVLDSASKPNLMISRRAVAQFMLECLTAGQYVKQKPVISSN
ncbi:NAD(P)-dependent oxidoreductase [Telluribacter sp. SYSU D00476]|uniref:NAD(P)-dependent oxidoreductase n=1 Tax=Telluribacter sp. SYSU D00476 TaxID=2811430 RepID=UPI001FF2DBA9|nr:SDR family oxidoreductase [Telluribacter sp. SYSU D00476]